MTKHALFHFLWPGGKKKVALIAYILKRNVFKIYLKMSTDVEFSISTDKVWKHRPKTHGLNMSFNWRREGVTNSFDKDDLRLRVGEYIVSRPCIKEVLSDEELHKLITDY